MENGILEYFKLLLDLGIALRVVFDGIKEKAQQKVAEQLQDIISDLKKILDEAERILILIQTADEKVKEYGEPKFINILQGNFRSQFRKIIDIAEKIENSKVFNKIDKELRDKLKILVRFKGYSIRIALQILSYEELKIENNQIFIIEEKNKKKLPAFPAVDKQKEILSQIKNYSQSLVSHIK